MVIETPSFTQLESNRDSNSPDLFLPAGRVQGCGSAGYAAPPRAGDEGGPGGGTPKLIFQGGHSFFFRSKKKCYGIKNVHFTARAPSGRAMKHHSRGLAGGRHLFW